MFYKKYIRVEFLTTMRSLGVILPTMTIQEDMEDLKVASNSGSPPLPILQEAREPQQYLAEHFLFKNPRHRVIGQPLCLPHVCKTGTLHMIVWRRNIWRGGGGKDRQDGHQGHALYLYGKINLIP